MNKIAFCQELFKDWKLVDIVKFLYKQNYDGIELAPFMLHEDIRNLQQEDVRNIKKEVVENGLEIPALHWCLASPKGLSISSLDPEVFGNTVDYFSQLISLSAALDSQFLVFGSPNQRNIDPTNPDLSYKNAVKFFEKVLPTAESEGVIIAFEPLGPSITNFGATTQEGLKLMETLNHPNFKIHLDTSALFRDGTNPIEQIKSVGKDLVYVHLNDTNQLGPGMGEIDFIPLLQTFKEIGYDGWFSVEPFRSDVPIEEIVEISIQYIRKIVN